jgi:carbon monoxide dehydrogenase subunit G
VKVSGSHDLSASPERVWAALTDPAVLARTLPGARSLERIGEDEYRVTVEAGVASIKGVYTGTVLLGDQRPPEAYTLRARGSGGPGTIDATAAVTLTPTDGSGTRVAYEADAVVGGTIGGVGQRVLGGVAKRTAAQFFSAVDAELSASLAVEAAPEVFAGRTALPTAPAGVRPYLVGALLGAALALLGVLVGRRTAS